MRHVGRRPRLRLAAAALLPFLLSSCAQHPASEQGAKVYTLYNIVLAIALLIGVGVVGMILLSCVRYRKRPGDDELPPQTHGNTTFEIIWTALPTLVVLSLFAMSFVTIRAIDKPNVKRAAVVEVRGYQWTWTFDYGTNAAGTRVVVRQEGPDKPPEMVVPVGETVHIEERSDNVIHSFFVPRFLFKRDVVPGKANGFDLTVSSPGVYGGQCAELCGTDHALMTFTVRAVGRTEFDKWFAEFKPFRPKCEETGKATSDVTITSPENLAEFTEKCAYVKAGAPTKLTFKNGGGLQHNVAVYDGSITSGGKLIAKTEIIQGGTVTAEVPALKTGGDYNYFCQVHPQMEGRWVVQ
ncbi:MAG TPA: cytochrome c oxidase subunit II [Mycobacteriales bacterium]|nr:cytochrome c oxidase subunit II [Mycobacteriales bacterium]